MTKEDQNICKEYIHKNSDDIKVVIFEVPSDNIDTIFYFDIKENDIIEAFIMKEIKR